MKKVYLLILALVAVFMSSCREKHTVEGLVKNIPDDAVFAMVADIQTIVENMGGTMTEGGIEMPSYLTAVADRDSREVFEALESGELGIDPGYAACFVTKDKNVYLMCYLDDPKKFKEYLEEQMESEFQDLDGGMQMIKKKRNNEAAIVVDGEKAWMAISMDGESKPWKKIAEYSNLDTDKSMAKEGIKEYIAKGGSTITCWANVKGLLKLMDDSGETSDANQLRLIQAATFKDLSYITLDAVFNNNQAEATVNFLDKQYKNTAMIMKMKNINVDAFANLKNNDINKAFIVAGLAIDKQQINAMLEQLQSTMGSSEYQMLKSLVQNISGTAVFAMNPLNDATTDVVVEEATDVWAEAEPDNWYAEEAYDSYDSYYSPSSYRVTNPLNARMMLGIPMATTSQDTMLSGLCTEEGLSSNRAGNYFMVGALSGNSGNVSVDDAANRFKNSYFGIATGNLAAIASEGRVDSNDITYVTAENLQGGGVQLKASSKFTSEGGYLEQLIKLFVSLDRYL